MTSSRHERAATPLRGGRRIGAGISSICLALVILGVTAAPGTSHQSPKNCDSNSIVLTPTRDKLVVRNGDTITYSVSVSNLDSKSQTACDLTNATVTLTLPAKNGTPTGKQVTLVDQVNYRAGTNTTFLGSTPWIVDVNPGIEDAVVQAEVAGTLHDAPVDHSARIIKTLGTTVTQPHTTLTKTAAPISGHAPLSVTYTYTETNDSTTDAPISDVVLTDDLCAPVTYVSGDTGDDDILGTGEVWTYSCAATFTTVGTFTNHVTATGTNLVDGKPAPDEFAEATVEVTSPPPPKPQIKITKTAPVQAAVGDDIAYRLEVSITVDRALQDVTVSDPICDSPPVLLSKNGGDQDDQLEMGEVWVYECRHVITAADVPRLDNVAAASGVDVSGVKTTDTDTAGTLISEVKPKTLTGPQSEAASEAGRLLPFTGLAIGLIAAIAMALSLFGTGSGLMKLGRSKGRDRNRRD